MAQPYVGEIRMFAGTFAPLGWQFCEGQLLAISENETLFQLIGTTYGGDGENTFALPDLRGRLPIHQGNGFTLAQSGGAEEITLNVSQIPAHAHPLLGTEGSANTPTPQNNVFARSSTDVFTTQNTPATMAPQAISAVGGSQPHTNFQPYLCVNFIISMFGIFPQRT